MLVFIIKFVTLMVFISRQKEVGVLYKRKTENIGSVRFVSFEILFFFSFS